MARWFRTGKSGSSCRGSGARSWTSLYLLPLPTPTLHKLVEKYSPIPDARAVLDSCAGVAASTSSSTSISTLSATTTRSVVPDKYLYTGLFLTREASKAVMRLALAEWGGGSGSGIGRGNGSLLPTCNDPYTTCIDYSSTAPESGGGGGGGGGGRAPLHCTLKYGRRTELSEEEAKYLGTRYSLRITGKTDHPLIQAFTLDPHLGGCPLPCLNPHPHLTIASAAGVSPVKANEVLLTEGNKKPLSSSGVEVESRLGVFGTVRGAPSQTRVFYKA